MGSDGCRNGRRRGLCFYWGDELVAHTRLRADVARVLSIVPESAPDGGDGLDESIVGDEGVLPERLYQFLPRHQALTVFDQVAQHLEGLGG